MFIVLKLNKTQAEKKNKIMLPSHTIQHVFPLRRRRYTIPIRIDILNLILWL